MFATTSEFTTFSWIFSLPVASELEFKLTFDSQPLLEKGRACDGENYASWKLLTGVLNL